MESGQSGESVALMPPGSWYERTTLSVDLFIQLHPACWLIDLDQIPSSSAPHRGHRY